jgi:hypothetical protein
MRGGCASWLAASLVQSTILLKVQFCSKYNFAPGLRFAHPDAEHCYQKLRKDVCNDLMFGTTPGMPR